MVKEYFITENGKIVGKRLNPFCHKKVEAQQLQKYLSKKVTIKLTLEQSALIRGILYEYASQHPEIAKDLKKIYNKLPKPNFFL